MKIPTSKNNVGVFVALEKDRVIAMYVISKMDRNTDLVINATQGRVDKIVNVETNATVVPLEANSLDISGLENTASYALSIKDPFNTSVDTLAGLDRSVTSGVEAMSSCGPSDAPKYAEMVAAAYAYEAASEAYDAAVDAAIIAADTAWFTCAMCPETVVVCTSCAIALGYAADKAIVARHKGVLKRKAAERVRSLARQVGNWVQSNCQ